jgi:hypothetical protein
MDLQSYMKYFKVILMMAIIIVMGMIYYQVDMMTDSEGYFKPLTRDTRRQDASRRDRESSSRTQRGDR